MNTKVRFLLLLFVLFNVSTTFSQTNEGGFPLEDNQSSLKGRNAIPTIVMPKTDFKSDHKKRGPLCGNIFAHKFAVDINLKEKGQHSKSGDFIIWRLGLKSENAYSLNIILKDFKVPTGARLFLYSPNQEQTKGAYTKANNTPYNFAISPIDGDEIIIAYEEPVNPDFKADLVIKRVNHDFKGLKTLPSFGSSESCHIEAASAPVSLTKRSSCELIIDGAVYCSGNLINNTNNDANPYIVSSSHCYWETYEELQNGQPVEKYRLDTNLVHTTVAFFNYEAPSEEWPIEGSREMSLSGAKMIASRKSRDMILIQMNEIPPVDFRPYYAGWNRESYISGPVYCFHHPYGDVKKISRDEATPSTASFDNTKLFYENSHWRIYRWDEGMTEGGSSGGALFDSKDHIVGCLTGGDTNANCDKPGDDYFWQLYKVWDKDTYDKNLGYWLDPKGSGVSVLDGLEPYKYPCRRISHRSWNEVPAVPEVENNKYYAVGTNNQGITEYSEKYDTEKEITLYGVYFFPVVAQYSSKRPVYLRIYKGANKPDSLIYEQLIRIQTKQYNPYKDKVFTEDTPQWGGMENYIRLKTPLKLDTTFFVSITVPETSITNYAPFALYYSDPKETEEQNTAFFKNADKQWVPFTAHPQIAAPTSLMVDVVVRDGWDHSDDLNPITPTEPPIDSTRYVENALCYPAFTTGELNIEIPKGDRLQKIQVTDMSGRTLYIKDGINTTVHYSFNVADICMQDNAYNVIATFKYANKKTFRFIKWRSK